MASAQRRTQDERRAETRARLLTATLECLEELGYAGATTRRIAERAEVSVGAVTHHFPYRVDLVTAAVEELVRRRLKVMAEALDAMPESTEERVTTALDMIWQDFSGPLFAVMVKLWVAAGDDHELYERLIPLERLLAHSVRAFAPEQLGIEPAVERRGELGLDPRFAIAIAAIRGLALSRAFEPRAGQVRDPWPALRGELARYLLS